MIAQQSTSDVISNPNKWMHSSTRRKQIKTTKTNIYYDDCDMAPFHWNKISRECDNAQSSP